MAQCTLWLGKKRWECGMDGVLRGGKTAEVKCEVVEDMEAEMGA